MQLIKLFYNYFRKVEYNEPLPILIQNILYKLEITYLKEQRCGGAGEVEGLGHVRLWVVLSGVTIDHHSFSCSLFTNQQDSFVLFGCEIVSQRL